MKTTEKLSLVQMAFYPGGIHNTVTGNGWEYYSYDDGEHYDVLESPLLVEAHALWYFTPHDRDFGELSKILTDSKKRFVVIGHLDRPECDMASCRPEVDCYAAKKVTGEGIEKAVYQLEDSGGKSIEIGMRIDIPRAKIFLPGYRKRKIHEIENKKRKTKEKIIQEILNLPFEGQRKRLEELLK